MPSLQLADGELRVLRGVVRGAQRVVDGGQEVLVLLHRRVRHALQRRAAQALRGQLLGPEK